MTSDAGGELSRRVVQIVRAAAQEALKGVVSQASLETTGQLSVALQRAMMRAVDSRVRSVAATCSPTKTLGAHKRLVEKLKRERNAARLAFERESAEMKHDLESLKRDLEILKSEAQYQAETSLRRLKAEHDRLLEVIEGEVTEASLEASRKRAELRNELARLRALIATSKRALVHPCYPDVPGASIEPSLFGNGLPESPGVYFLWREGVVDYVGKSVNLKNRLRLNTHHVLKDYHLISWLQWERAELDWTEAFYIGVCRPLKNFGLNAAHGGNGWHHLHRHGG